MAEWEIQHGGAVETQHAGEMGGHRKESPFSGSLATPKIKRLH